MKRGSLARWAAAYESAMWRSLFGWVLRRPVRHAPGAELFGYVGAVRPILIAFIVLSAVEIPIFDLIVSHLVPWRPARFIVLALGAYGLLWMLGLLAMVQRHPHVVGDDGIRVRSGVRLGVDLTVPWDRVAEVRRRYRPLPSSRTIQIDSDRSGPIVHVAAGGQTNVEVQLRQPVALALPVGPSEPTTRVRLYVDDPDRFVAVVRQHLTVRERAHSRTVWPGSGPVVTRPPSAQ